MWSPLHKYTVKQFKKGASFQLCTILLSSFSLFFTYVPFIYVLLLAVSSWYLLGARHKYGGLICPLLSFPLSMYVVLSGKVFPAVPALLLLNTCFFIYSIIVVLLFRNEFKDESA